jgi:glycosyltransferase involved in cell wall biosynthesis
MLVNYINRMDNLDIPHQTPALSVIMPAYNEAGHIFKNIEETLLALNDAGIDAEIVAVDDGSTDSTLAEIERASAVFDRVRAARNTYNMGKGMALRTGFDHSRGQIIVFLDADLDLHPSQIEKLLEELRRGSYDVVVTSKHHPDSQLAYPFTRKVASLVYYFVIRMLFKLPVRDTQTGLKLFRREVLERVFHRLLVKTYAYDVELLATAVRFGYKVREIPVVLDYKRRITWGRIKPGDVLRIFADTLAVFYRLRILAYYDQERPRSPSNYAPVLVVTCGTPPEDVVIRRLSLDSNTRIAAFGVMGDARPTWDSLSFSDADIFLDWLLDEGSDVAYIGFLGSGCTPLGSWVKNAIANFADESVVAVCGPVVPGPGTSLGQKVAAMLYSSILTMGPDYYLRTITRARQVGWCAPDNQFIRAAYLRTVDREAAVRMIGFGTQNNHDQEKNKLRYDPDVAISRTIPPFFRSYMRSVAHEAILAGERLFESRNNDNRFWAVVPFFLVIIFVFSLFLPREITEALAAGYATAVLFSGIVYLEPLAFPGYVAGIIIEHLVQAFAVPFGIVRNMYQKIGSRS